MRLSVYKPIAPSYSANATAGSASLPCPQCAGPTNVVDSRPREGAIRRRRVCRKCDLRFSTFEQYAENAGLGFNDRSTLIAISEHLKVLAGEVDRMLGLAEQESAP